MCLVPEADGLVIVQLIVYLRINEAIHGLFEDIVCDWAHRVYHTLLLKPFPFLNKVDSESSIELHYFPNPVKIEKSNIYGEFLKSLFIFVCPVYQ